MKESGEIRIDFGDVAQLLRCPGDICGFVGEINMDEFKQTISQRFGEALQHCEGAIIEIGCHKETSTAQLSDLMNLFLELIAKKSHLVFGTKHSQNPESKTYFCKLIITGLSASKSL